MQQPINNNLSNLFLLFYIIIYLFMKTKQTYKLHQNDPKTSIVSIARAKIKLDLEQTVDSYFYFLLELFFIEIFLLEFPKSIFIHFDFFAVFADFKNL